MNNLLFFKRNNFSSITNSNYGISYNRYKLYTLKNNFSKKLFFNKIDSFFNNIFEKESQNFNRLLRFSKKKQIEELKKQSSWRSLRLRQGLPVNGQRTHSNARNSKKLNSSMFLYDV